MTLAKDHRTVLAWLDAGPSPGVIRDATKLDMEKLADLEKDATDSVDRDFLPPAMSIEDYRFLTALRNAAPVLLELAKRAEKAENELSQMNGVRERAQLAELALTILDDRERLKGCVDAMQRAENLELRALIARAGEVLRPIVNIALLYDGDRATGGVDGIKFPDEWPVYARASECNEIGSLSVGWFRAARALAAELRKAGEGT